MGSITETPPFELRVVLELRDVVDRGQELGRPGDRVDVAPTGKERSLRAEDVVRTDELAVTVWLDSETASDVLNVHRAWKAYVLLHW